MPTKLAQWDRVLQTYNALQQCSVYRVFFSAHDDLASSTQSLLLSFAPFTPSFLAFSFDQPVGMFFSRGCHYIFPSRGLSCLSPLDIMRSLFSAHRILIERRPRCLDKLTVTRPLGKNTLHTWRFQRPSSHRLRILLQKYVRSPTFSETPYSCLVPRVTARFASSSV